MSLQKPVTGEFFVALFDLTNFGIYYRNNSSEAVFDTLSEFSRLATSAVESAGGRIIKFSNDNGVAIFSADDVDAAVGAFIKLKTQVDEWARRKSIGSQLAMNAHVGTATWGSYPNGSSEIVGEAVSVVYSMGKKQFQISPQTFRKLSSYGRKEFRKYTPPIVYKLGAST